MIEDNIHVIKNDPLIIVDKFPYTKKRDALRISGMMNYKKYILYISFVPFVCVM